MAAAVMFDLLLFSTYSITVSAYGVVGRGDNNTVNATTGGILAVVFLVTIVLILGMCSLCANRRSSPGNDAGLPVVKIVTDSITEQPVTLRCIPGQLVTLGCTVFATPAPTDVFWQRIDNGVATTLTMDETKYSGSTIKNPSLTIKSAGIDDFARYTCSATNAKGTGTSGESIIERYSPPTLYMIPRIHNKTEGQAVVLKCTVDSTPSTVKWNKEGREISIDNDRYFMGPLQSPALIISNMDKQNDEGEYTCEASNIAGPGSTSVTLMIASPSPDDKTGKRTDTKTDAPTEEDMVRAEKLLIHGDMVVNLSKFVYPGGRHWKDFVTLVRAYLDPAEVDGSLCDIVENLLMKKLIEHGQYKKLHDIVDTFDKTASPIIKEAERKMQLGMSGTNDTPAEVKMESVGNYSENVKEQAILQVTKELEDAEGRVTGRGQQGSIVLTFTLSAAKTPHELSALDLAVTLRTKLHNKQIVLEDESQGPLVLKTKPTVRIPTDPPKATPTVRLSRRYYRFEEGKDAIVKCVVVDQQETTSIEWFKGKGDGHFDAIYIDSMKYFCVSPQFPSLVISDLNKEDKGIYFCRVGNTEGTEESNMAFVDINVTEEDPKVEIQESYIAVMGRSVELTWSAYAFPSIQTVSWQHKSPDGQTIQLTIDQQKYTSPNPNCLVINCTSKADEGKYVCIICDYNDKRLSATTQLMVEGEDPTVEMQENYAVVMGKSVELTWSASTFPFIKAVSWQHISPDGQTTQLTIDQQKYTSPKPNCLVINCTSKADEGKYMCTICDYNDTRLSATTQLMVEGEDPTVEMQENYAVVMGESVELTWSASAFPFIESISWQHISPEGKTTQLDIDEQKYTRPKPNCLVINNTSKADEGEYVCAGFDWCGRRRSATTKVMVEGAVPTVTVAQSTYTVNTGTSVQLVCTVSSVTTVTSVFWQRTINGVTTTLTIDNGQYVGSSTQVPSLTVINADTADSGSYTCFATNTAGTGISAATTLTVVGTAPTVTVGSSAYTTTTGTTFTLQCTVTSATTLTNVFWQRTVSNGVPTTVTIDGVNFSGGSNGAPSLTVISASPLDTGSYTCFGSNAAGTSSATTQLTVSGNATTREDIKTEILRIHAVMVIRLSQFVYPKARYWEDFTTLVSTYLDPAEREGSLQDIVHNLMKKNHIAYGQYDTLYDVVHAIDQSASLIIKEAESNIKTVKMTDATTQEDIKTEILRIHADMVIRLSQFVYPKARYWEDFTTLVSTYLDPAEREGSLQDIVHNLMKKNHIAYGQYDTLYDVVHAIDQSASLIIKEAESNIKTVKMTDPPTVEDINTEIKWIHADMVIKLSIFVYPKARYWNDFMTFVGVYLDPTECEGSLYNIVHTLMKKGHIEYGHYAKLYDAVHAIDQPASAIIKEAESQIKTLKELNFLCYRVLYVR